MEKSETIEHHRRFDVFEHLLRDRTLVKMNLIGKPFEHLTVVTGTRVRQNVPFFLIDCPEGFRDATADMKDCRIHFEFIGHDHIIYKFRTSGREFVQNEVCIRFPDTIYRLQRRNDFRVSPPIGTKLRLKVRQQHEFSILNLSRTGALINLAGSGRSHPDPPVFSIGSRFKNVELTFPLDKMNSTVHILEIQIKRLGKHPVTDKDTCALEFIHSEKNQEKKLIRLLYRFQRELLQRKMVDLPLKSPADS